MSDQPTTIDVLAEPQWSQGHTAYHAAVDAHNDVTRDLIAHREQADKLAPVIDGFLAGVTSTTVGHELSSQVRNAVAKVRSTADAAFREADRMRVNDDIALGGRTRRVAETVTEARAKVAEQAEQAEVALTIAEAVQEVEVLGTVDPKREAFARADAEASLNGKTDLGGLQRLARDPDPDVRALVAGEWGRRRAEAAAGSAHAGAEAHKALRSLALDHATREGTDAQRKAAEGLAALREARKAVTAARAYGQIKLRGFPV